MGKDTNKIENSLKKKKRRIGVIAIATIVIISIITIALITHGQKFVLTDSKSNIGATSTSSTKSSNDKTACGIKIKFLYKEKYWEKYDLTNAVYKTQDDYETAVCNYIDEIAKLLNKQDWYKQDKDKDTLYLKLVIVGKDYYAHPETNSRKEEYDDTMPIYDYGSSLADYTPTSYVYTMTFNSAMFDHNIVPLVHQLTHLITYNQIDKRTSFSDSLSIGLGEYVQKSLGMGIDSCNHGLDIHNYVIEHKKIYENNPSDNSFLEYMNRFLIGGSDFYAGAYSSGTVSARNYSIECCSSFVDYLVQTYGLTNVMKMVEGYDESIYYLFNPNGLSGVVSDWQQFLANYPCKMTWDEMSAFITGFKSTHGY